MNRIALGLSLAASSIAFGQVLAYEPFEYPAGDLRSQNGGVGFAEPWQQDVTTNDITAGSIPYEGTIGLGNKALTGGQQVDTIRALDGNYGFGETTWISILIQVDETNTWETNDACFGGLTLVRENGDEALRIGQAWADGVWGYSQAFVSDVRSDVAMDTTPRQLLIRMVDPGLGNPDGGNNPDNGNVQETEISLWVDPSFDAGDEPSDPIVAEAIDELGNPLGYSSKIYGGGFNRIRVNSNQFLLLNVDEIKIGTSYQEVIGDLPTIAYEPFDYTPESINSTMNGGTGFSGPWSDAAPVNSTDEDGISTSCSSELGGSGRTGGNGAGAFRYLDGSYGTSGEPETVYYSVVGRTNPDNPVAEGNLEWYAGASLFNGDQEVLFIGKPWNASFWGFDAQDGGCDALPESCGQGLFEINDVPRLIVVKMDFDGIGGATTSLWVEPTDCLEGTPDVVYEDANNPGFNRIRFQAGNGPAYMDFDEVRLGRTWNDVVPNDGGSDCPEDINGDGIVGFGDVLEALSAWGASGGAADVDGDGVVAFGDVLAVLSAFGPC